MSKYRVEIQQMMFILGEVQDPLQETTVLVEELIRGQVMEMLIQANELALRRGSRSISVEDLFFLIRHDKAKVNRLKNYLSWKDVRKNAKEQDANATDTKELLEDADLRTKIRKAPVTLPWEIKFMFPEPIPDPEDYEEDNEMAEAASATRERLRMADERTRQMTREEYVHWSECRQASFTYRKGKRFREWCGMALLTETRPNDDIVDILGFLTFEIVATLIEEALAVKQRMDQLQNENGSLAHQTKRRKERYLFDGLTEERTPLQVCHVMEAFRRLQLPRKKHTAMRNFNGGLLKTRVNLI
ncbi:SAGA complex subunit Spt3 [Schizosaccharomyces japonicus yFS275]|uniref:SAGA complex subunit Spt3 n=1 Tax=Schizosaccharomyces japonicus (strain yFS275 / FY16936) TaxID=402676 RepID=B6K4V4_SCHJY|nr:SAGA complex subunit Spt3 [Schizosaccharomyces japonicus yFS275]EEB08511.1 SAGA complex subunit Spt3 [Schizosaccharomyces japonicus yFS275]